MAAVSKLPSGAPRVGAGLAVLGVSTYGFLLVSAHALSPAHFATLSVLYMLVYTVGPGAFLPFEQEIARTLADLRARAMPSADVLRRALTLGCVCVAALTVLVAVTSPAYTGRLFDGAWLLVVGLLLSVVGLGLEYVSRGVFAGRGHFGRYGAQLAIEGASRFVACAILAAVGVHEVGAYGVVLGAAFVVALVLTSRDVFRSDEPTRPDHNVVPNVEWSRLAGTVGWLAVGSLMAQTLVNVGPIALKLIAARDSSAAPGQLLAGLALARLPLFLFAAVQAALLPGLAGLLAASKLHEFGAGMRRLLVVIGALSGAMTLVLGLVGPQLLQALFGASYHLGRVDLVVLSLATGLFMVATVVGNGLLALRRFGLAALAWAAGVATLVGVIAAPMSLFARVEYSFLAGAAVSAAAAGGLLFRAARSHRRAAELTPAVLGAAVQP